MQVKANVKHIHLSPRKARLVINIVRGLSLTEALNRLALINLKGVRPLLKLLNSALANAEHNHELQKDNLFIKEIKVDAGPILYRWMPKAHGSATPMRRRTASLSVILAEKVETIKKLTKKEKKITTIKTEEKLPDKIETKLSVSKNDLTGKEALEERADKKFDSKHKGGHRDVQSQEKLVHKSKGIFRKMFRRKAGE